MLDYFKINQYKSNDLSTSIEEDKDILSKEPKMMCYHNIREKRRTVKKTLFGDYNYIPKHCTINNCKDENCKFAHNEIENNYHPLVYKIRLCRIKNCDDRCCFNSHGLLDDFRIIFDYNDEKIITLLNFFNDNFNDKSYLSNKNDSFSKIYSKISPISKCIQRPLDFNIDNFKVLKCEIPGPNCSDNHKCLLYHNANEKIRPQKLYRYTNQLCEIAYKGKNEFYPEYCSKKDFCNKCHTKYEFYYHPLNFRNIRECI